MAPIADLTSPAGPAWPSHVGGRRTDRGLLSGRTPGHRPRNPTTFTSDVRIGRSPQEVFDFCRRDENFAAIMPDRIVYLAGTGEGRDGLDGGVYVFRWWMFNLLPITWVAYIDHLVPGEEFSDLQLRGIFRYFRHTHQCLSEGTHTRYRDTIEFATSLGPVLDRTCVLPLLRRTFRHRHRRMRQLLGEATP